MRAGQIPCEFWRNFRERAQVWTVGPCRLLFRPENREDSTQMGEYDSRSRSPAHAVATAATPIQARTLESNQISFDPEEYLWPNSNSNDCALYSRLFPARSPSVPGSDGVGNLVILFLGREGVMDSLPVLGSSKPMVQTETDKSGTTKQSSDDCEGSIPLLRMEIDQSDVGIRSKGSSKCSSS